MRMVGENFFKKSWRNYEDFEADFKHFYLTTNQVFSKLDSRTVQKSIDKRLSQAEVVAFNPFHLH